VTAARALAALAAVVLPPAARAQGQVVTDGTGWPFEWMIFFFSVAALVAVLAFVVLAVRWRQNPPRPGR
jgi:hypothetical protein